MYSERCLRRCQCQLLTKPQPKRSYCKEASSPALPCGLGPTVWLSWLGNYCFFLSSCKKAPHRLPPAHKQSWKGFDLAVEEARRNVVGFGRCLISVSYGNAAVLNYWKKKSLFKREGEVRTWIKIETSYKKKCKPFSWGKFNFISLLYLFGRVGGQLWTVVHPAGYLLCNQRNVT